jgi:O-antigen/teichoic acid export membrane protein
MKNNAKRLSLEMASALLASAPGAGLRSRLLSGSLILLAASALVGVMNLLYNVVVARMLGPTGFSHATAVYTLLMLISAITLSFQVVCAKLVASHQDVEQKAAVYAWLHRRAWRFGLSVALFIVLIRNIVVTYLNLPSSDLVIILALGTAIYIPLGVRRGGIQGIYGFRSFAGNLVLEGAVRLISSYVLIRLGMGVRGAVIAGVAGVIVAYFFALPGPMLKATSKLAIPASFREGLQAIVFFVGQVIINNFDIVLVKHFFPSEEAGLYAAISLVGRVVNMCAWSVVSSMFPVSAGAQAKEREGGAVLLTSLSLVILIIGVLLLGLWMVPSFLWNMVFGAQFQIAAYGAIPSLLMLYAVTTGVYSLSAVIIAYEMSRKIANTGWVQLAFSGAIVLGIYKFHGSLEEVILVQLVLMTALLGVVLLPVLLNRVAGTGARSHVFPDDRNNVRIIKPITEQEAVAEFLRNEFHHPEFDEYRDNLAHLITRPDFLSPKENELRRALLYLRRGAMWRELPADTQWFEVQITPEDLAGIRVFPRAQWRKVSQGSFYLNDIVKRINVESAEHPEEEFFNKLRRLSTNDAVNPAVLLIGVNETQPLTILDGNHRIASAMLVAPATVLKRFRFLCGFSPNMTNCCWYETNVNTLWRYAKNLVRNVRYDPENDISRFLQSES